MERLDLEADAASVARARAFVVRVLHEWGLDSFLDTAALLTSELATNAVLHARTPYAVVVARTSYGAQVDVLDHSNDAPRLRPPDLSAVTGRGLALVDGLSTRWGPTPSDGLAGFRKGVRVRIG